MPLFLLALLTACATPRERCEAEAMRELNTLAALITETEQNLAHGYAIEREEVSRPVMHLCVGTREDGTRSGYVFCTETETRIVERPVAIDPAAEKRKLASLKARYETQKRAAAKALAACAATYPDG